MAGESYLISLREAIVNLDFDGIHKAAQEAMDAGVEPQVAIMEGMVPAMAVVGDKFESGHPVAVAPIVLNSLRGLYS